MILRSGNAAGQPRAHHSAVLPRSSQVTSGRLRLWIADYSVVALWRSVAACMSDHLTHLARADVLAASGNVVGALTELEAARVMARRSMSLNGLVAVRSRTERITGVAAKRGEWDQLRRLLAAVDRDTNSFPPAAVHAATVHAAKEAEAEHELTSGNAPPPLDAQVTPSFLGDVKQNLAVKKAERELAAMKAQTDRELAAKKAEVAYKEAEASAREAAAAKEAERELAAKTAERERAAKKSQAERELAAKKAERELAVNKAWRQRTFEPGAFSVILLGLRQPGDYEALAKFLFNIPVRRNQPFDEVKALVRAANIAPQAVAEDVAKNYAKQLRDELAIRGGKVMIKEGFLFEPGPFSVILYGLRKPGDYGTLAKFLSNIPVLRNQPPEELKALVERAAHIAPQMVAENIGQTTAIQLKKELVLRGGKVRIKETPIRRTSDGRREPIPERVRNEVWRRDGGQCVDCGSREKLEYDHIVAISNGGSNTARNLELRCESCNRKKAAKI